MGYIYLYTFIYTYIPMGYKPRSGFAGSQGVFSRYFGQFSVLAVCLA